MKGFSLSKRGRCFTIMGFIIVCYWHYVDPNAKLFRSRRLPLWLFLLICRLYRSQRHFPFPCFFNKEATLCLLSLIIAYGGVSLDTNCKQDVCRFYYKNGQNEYISKKIYVHIFFSTFENSSNVN